MRNKLKGFVIEGYRVEKCEIRMYSTTEAGALKRAAKTKYVTALNLRYLRVQRELSDEEVSWHVQHQRHIKRFRKMHAKKEVK